MNCQRKKTTINDYYQLFIFFKEFFDKKNFEKWLFGMNLKVD